MSHHHYAQQVTELNHLIADQLEAYAEHHPGLPATVVLTALGEALVNLGVRHMGVEYTERLCQQLQTAVNHTRQ